MYKIWFVFYILIAFICAQPCFADGCFIPKTANSIALTRDADITEPNQNAFIAFREGKEHLIIQVKYRGRLSEFLWLVPTPSKPTVKRFQNTLFEELHKFTALPVKYWFDSDRKILQYSYGLQGGAGMMGGPGLRGGTPLAVDVIKWERIGIYDTVILKSTNAVDLRKWLNDNGYPVPENAIPVLADYLKRGWVFTAMRVNIQTAKSGWKGQKEGLLEPLHFTFASEKPIYPLKISSLNPGRTEVLLYVTSYPFVSSRLLKTEGTYRGFQPILLLDRNEKGEVITDPPANYAKFGNDGKAKMLLRKEYSLFELSEMALTKLRGTFKSSEMTQDITLEESRNWVSPIPISPPLLENIGSLGLFTFVAVQSFPYTMLVPAIMALICLKGSKPAQHLRLCAIGIICAVWLFLPSIRILGEPYVTRLLDFHYITAVIFRWSTLDIEDYSYGDPYAVFYILISITLLITIVLTIFSIRSERNRRNKAMLLFGCVYAIFASVLQIIGYPANIARYAYDLQNFSVYGIISIVSLALFCIFTAVKLIKKHQHNSSSRDNVDVKLN